MKNLYYSIIFTCCFFYHLNAQNIPNGNFENWTGTRPTSWETTNGLMSAPFNNPQTIFQSTDAYSGTYACEIQTKKMRSKPAGVFIPDYAGSMFVGRQISIRSIPGFAFAERPNKMQFYYKFNARNNDSATIRLLLTRWNTAENKRDTLASNFNYLLDSVNVYTKKEIILNYLDTLQTPDTAIIFITSATSFAQAEGAKLLIDELKFSGGTVGLNNPKQALKIEVYPNPSTGVFNLNFGSNQNMERIESIEILDSVGKKVPYTLDENTLEVKANSGLYYLVIRTTGSQFLKLLAIN